MTTDKQNPDAVFIKPTVPENSWQLVCWCIFEPELLQQYSNTLSRKQGLLVLLRTCPLLIALCSVVYLSSSALIIGFELPLFFPEQFKPELIELFSGQHSILNSYKVYIQNTVLTFSLTLAWGLALGLAGGLAWGLTWGLALGLAWGLTWGLALGLAGGLAGGLAWGLALGLAGGLTFYLAYFRFIFYPFYYVFKMDFYHAPYLYDATIWLPIWRAKTRLCESALSSPETAAKFVTFLRTYRPLQTRLADNIAHAALAGCWLPHPLQLEYLQLPIIEHEKLKPSANWSKQLAILKTQLISFQQQSNIHTKLHDGLQLLKELETFKKQTLVENPSWRDYYLKAIELWLKVANEQLEQLKLQALSHEPITANVYLSGEALNPERHRAIFLGRDDLKNQFAFKVQTAAQMPMFLIQGQRRTGKTSLLNFLEPLLGAGFRVIKQDLQDVSFNSIPNWLADLQQRINPYLDTAQPEPVRSEDWLQGWQSVQTGLSRFNGNSHYKLILAFDEYEAIHTLLQRDPAQGERLLAAMRSFSQQQNKVVFLFVGAALFSELEQPNWSTYFVQMQRFRVDYLKHDDAIRLITEPVKLNYPPEVCEQMFELTQGHPALLQLLCSKMVDIANTGGKRDMSQADLDAIVQEVSNERETSAILIFWKDFCADPVCKQTVKQILNGETIEPNQQLYRLEEHGFIVEQNGRWQMRVPLFTLWLKRFADRVL